MKYLLWHCAGIDWTNVTPPVFFLVFWAFGQSYLLFDGVAPEVKRTNGSLR